MVSSARNAAGAMVVSEGNSNTVDASTWAPTLAPSRRSQVEVSRLA